MSINKIRLSPHLLADLYADTLVVTESISMPESAAPASEPVTPPATASTPQVAATATPRRHLGSNAQRIAIIVHQPEFAFLPDGELQFLTTILTACKLGLGDIALINAAGRDAESFTEQLDELGSEKVILFGVEPLGIGLPIHFPPFRLQAFNKRTYLHGPALPELESDKNVKLQLWNCLKTLFAL